MNILVWKLLRRRVSVPQLAGFFLANLFGMTVVLLSVQAYSDVSPLLGAGDSFLKRDYLVLTKRISTLGSLSGSSNAFTPEEIDDLRRQRFARSVGAFTPSLFDVSAGVGTKQDGIRFSTAMFFEAVPDPYVDISLERWTFMPDSLNVPIIVPRNYLNLYNFGFAQSRNLPKLSEGMVSLMQLDIVLRGNGHTDRCRGQIVGFSNRLNTILVPQSFIDWANRRYAPGRQAAPSRLIVEVDNPADADLADYCRLHRYEAEGNGLDAGKTAYFLRLSTGIVGGVGMFISLLSFYILVLSIFLLLQKDADKLRNLLLIGYSPAQAARPYIVLAATLNVSMWILSAGLVCVVREGYLPALQALFPSFRAGGILPALVTGFVLTAVVVTVNAWLIRRKIHRL